MKQLIEKLTEILNNIKEEVEYGDITNSRACRHLLDYVEEGIDAIDYFIRKK